MNFTTRLGILLLATFLATPTEAKWSTMPNPNYVEPGTPFSQTAVLSVYDDHGPLTLTVIIESIDGQKYKCPRGYPNCSFLVRLTPGKHQIGLTYRNMNGGLSRYQYANVVVDVDLKAGTVYVVRVAVTKEDIAFAAKPFPPGTPYKFPAVPMRKKSSLEGLFEKSAEPQKK